MARKRKPFHVFKNTNGVYYVRVPDKSYASGYRKESLGVTNERDAYREAEALVSKEGASPGEGRTLHDAVLKFFGGHAKALTARSAERYATSYTAVKPVLGALAIDEIGTSQIDEFVQARRRQRVTDRTIRRDLMFVSSVYTQAAIWEWTERNPVADYMRRQKPKSGLKRKVSRKRYLSHDEEARLVKTAEAYLAEDCRPGHKLEHLMSVAAIFVSIDQGLRRGELTAALCEHVDRTKGGHGQWHIPRYEKADADEDAQTGPVKSEPRDIPLLGRARLYLDMLPAHAEAPWIFWHGAGEQYGRFDMTLKKLCGPKRANIKGLTWHDLRRTCGCRRLQDDRWPIERVSQYLGHQNVQVTREHYAFLNVEHLHAEVTRRDAQVQELSKNVTNPLSQQLKKTS